MSVTEGQEFVASRVFNGPRPLVYACFTDAERMKHWWGPKGVEIVNGTMDFRVGGLYHYGMKWPTGAIMWGRLVFREIVPPSRIVFLNSFSDEKAGLTRAPFSTANGRSRCSRRSPSRTKAATKPDLR